MKTVPPERLSTGVLALDDILRGGLLSRRAYMVRGGPGTGKTILGLHFLTAGVLSGEKTLFISLGEPEAEVRKNAGVLGFDLKDIVFLDLSPTPEFFAEMKAYDIFSPSEVEREPTTQKIVKQVEVVKPQRVFIDDITQFRYLTADAFQFRKQVLSFLRFLEEHGATALFSSEFSELNPDDDLQFMSDGVIQLDYAQEGRTIRVLKFRGSDFQGGRHTMRLTNAGMKIFPRLIPEAFKREFEIEPIPSGVPELDELLHGGIERGTVTIITGPSGVGKTTVALQSMREAAGRGERSVVYTFEEDVGTILKRSEGINLPVRSMIERGTLSIMQVEPLRYTADEFACMVRREVEEQNSGIVMLDSVAGYQLSLRGENLVENLHALTRYLENMGVTVILINEVEFITGEFRATEIGISYLADTIIFLRYLERQGEIRKAIGVLKKRVSDFEKTLREIEITRYGIKVGKPLTGLRGILRGTPEWVELPKKD